MPPGTRTPPQNPFITNQKTERRIILGVGCFLVLGWLILSTRKLQHFLNISTIIVLISGLGTWVIGPSRSVHLGASGLIFGYFGFLLLVGYFERSVKSILIAIVVFFLYGSIIWGVLPIAEGVSWQAHLFGFVGGAFAAYLTGRRVNGTS